MTCQCAPDSPTCGASLINISNASELSQLRRLLGCQPGDFTTDRLEKLISDAHYWKDRAERLEKHLQSVRTLVDVVTP